MGKSTGEEDPMWRLMREGEPTCGKGCLAPAGNIILGGNKEDPFCGNGGMATECEEDSTDATGPTISMSRDLEGDPNKVEEKDENMEEVAEADDRKKDVENTVRKMEENQPCGA